MCLDGQTELQMIHGVGCLRWLPMLAMREVLFRLQSTRVKEGEFPVRICLVVSWFPQHYTLV